MTKILIGLEGAICMMDDMLIIGASKKEYDTGLAKALEKMKKSRVSLNKDR